LKSLILSVFATAVLLGSISPAFSQIGIDVQIAPPAPRVVVVPPPRVGWEWAPGYWRWDGHQHVWVEGRWLHARPGFHWVGEHWVEHHGHYRFVQGHWARG
jgi:hypothetical protein